MLAITRALEIAVLDRIRYNDGCWEWTGKPKAPMGYGVFVWEDRQYRAHRLTWEIAHGPIPNGLCVLHRCDNPICVRPSHLFLGTRAENAADRDAKGRTRGACERLPIVDGRKQCRTCGEVRPIDEFSLTRRDGYRAMCKPCNRIANRAYYATKRAARSST